MKATVLLFAFAFVGLGCFGGMETKVRTVAARTFQCADYAIEVSEVGPYVYRVSGCHQELVYECQPSEGLLEPEPIDEIMGDGTDPIAVCTEKQ